jgi:3-oxoacyl-[acyl-carrier protein] reductase
LPSSSAGTGSGSTLRLGRPEDVAGTFAFLASDDAAFIHGETIVIDGGQLAE